MKKLIAILSMVGILALGAGPALAGNLYIGSEPFDHMPLTDAEWAEAHNRGVVLDSIVMGSDPFVGGPLTDAEFAEASNTGVVLRGIVKGSGPIDETLLTEDEWRKAYYG